MNWQKKLSVPVQKELLSLRAAAEREEFAKTVIEPFKPQKKFFVAFAATLFTYCVFKKKAKKNHHSAFSIFFLALSIWKFISRYKKC